MISLFCYINKDGIVINFSNNRNESFRNHVNLFRKSYSFIRQIANHMASYKSNIFLVIIIVFFNPAKMTRLIYHRWIVWAFKFYKYCVIVTIKEMLHTIKTHSQRSCCYFHFSI